MRLVGIVAVCLGMAWGAVAEPVTTAGLIEETVDMYRLTRYPSPAFKTVQFSSRDRTASLPGGRGWFSNSDGFGGEVTPNFEEVIKASDGTAPGEYLMCDVAGPGAIVRLWTARIGGNVRVYLDNLDTPVYDGPAEPFFLRPYDSFLEGSGLTPDVFDGALYQRNAAYAPIPFAKRLRIVWVGNPKEIHFYEIQVRQYEPSAQVVTFSRGDLAANADTVRRIASVLGSVDANWPYRSTRGVASVSATVAPHTQAEGLKLGGPGAIERLVLKVDAPDRDRALRQTVMHIICDDAPWGQVQAPVGDFFGAGPGINPFSSVPFSVAADGTMTCRYVMPHKESLRIVFENRGDQEVSVQGSALPADYAWDDESSMHFRAKWRVDHDLVASNDASMGVQDLPFLIGRGQGVYVGTAVMLLNPNNIPSPGGNWWGEGDEKIFVDDDKTPSTFGTGSEDYFNYAWSATDLFTFPYCGQPRNDGPANRGFVVNYRWHVIDPLPFARNIAFYMELFSHERTEGFSYARIGYHYARPGMMDDMRAITDEDVRPLSLPETWEPAARGAAANRVFTACEDLVSDVPVAFETGGVWQGGRVMIWTPAKTGDELTMTFSTEAEGEYRLGLACMFRPGCGSVRASVDGAPVGIGGEALKLGDPHNMLSRWVESGPVTLMAGSHTFTLTAEEGGKPVGLDFFSIGKP